ncbi:MAG: hypothetical protein ABJB66_12560 [Gemmatimonadaceae bacterium]
MLRVLLVSVSFGLASSSTAQASARAPLSSEDRLFARAESLTVGDYCRVARASIASTDIVKAMGARSSGVQLSTDVICAPSLVNTPLIALRGDQPATLSGVARIHSQQYVELHRRTLSAMKTFFTIMRADDMLPVAKAALDDTMNALLVRTTETVNSLMAVAARDSALVRLSNYERKLGPTSARLNVAEVFINYAAQRFIPGFSPSKVTGPSPWEVVASYVPTYGTVADKRLQAVSASEFGLRRYMFGEQFGAPGWTGVLLPSYWSAGALVVSDNNGALVWPWQNHQRIGAFISWGSIKAGFVPGRKGQFLLSRQMQVIPFVF